MKNGKLLLVLFVSICFSGCGRQIKTYEETVVEGRKIIYNMGKPARPEMEINFNPIQEIVGFKELTPDKTSFFSMTDAAYYDNKYYIWNWDDLELFIYDQNGNLIKNKCFNGAGPAELEEYSAIYISDHIYLHSTLGKIVVLDHELELVKSTHDFARLGLASHKIYVNKTDKSIYLMGDKIFIGDDGLMIKYTVKIIDSEFNDLCSYEMETIDFNLFLEGDFFSKSAVVTDNEVITGICNDTEPSFDVFDKQLNYKYTFKNKKIKTERTEKEKEIIRELYGENIFEDNPFIRTKRVWDSIHYLDKYKLFVTITGSLENSNTVFRFYSDGVLVSLLERKYNTPQELKDTKLIIRNNRLFEYNSESNNIIVYDIEIK